MGRGKRYSGGKKLNMKKVIAVIIAIIVVIMFIAMIAKLLTPKKKEEKKVVTLSYFSVYTENKWGVINSKGETVIVPEYDEMITIPDATKPVFICTYDVNYETGSYKAKVVNEKNEILFNEYDKIEVLENHDKQNNLFYEKSCLKIEKDGLYGLIDLTGKIILAPDYTEITPLLGTANSFITTKDGKKGLVDATGNVIIKNEYATIESITEKYENGYIVKNDSGKYGVVGYNKKVILEPIYDEIKHIYHAKYYAVKEGGVLKVIDTEKTTLVEGKMDDVIAIEGENIVIQKGNQYGIINTNGEVTVPVEYENLSYAFSNYYIAKKEGKYGMINSSNEIKVAFDYQSLIYRKEADIIEGQKEVVESELLDRDFQVKVTGIVSEVNVENGYMKIREGNEYHYYNFKFEKKNNTELLKNNTLYLSKKDGKYGYVNKDGVVVVNYQYDDATEQNAYGYVAVKKDGKWGSLDEKGNTVIEPIYSLENNSIIQFIGKWHLAADANANYYTNE